MLSKGKKEWVLDYLSSGKVTVPYEQITDYDFLNNVPDNDDFFLKHQFFSSLKDTVMSDQEYENVKNFYKTLKLQNLGELNKIYNFQDTIILCEIIEHHLSFLQNIFKYNS